MAMIAQKRMKLFILETEDVFLSENLSKRTFRNKRICFKWLKRTFSKQIIPLSLIVLIALVEYAVLRSSTSTKDALLYC